MESEVRKKLSQAMYRRWVYMAVAILAAALLPVRPAFTFQEDKGIIYVRSFSMDERQFEVTQTEIQTGIERVTERMSVKGLFYSRLLMLLGTILCFLCFFSNKWRIVIAVSTAVTAGVYYAFMVFYAIRISDVHFATISPTWTAILPAIVLEMMLLVRQNIISSAVYRDEFPE